MRRFRELCTDLLTEKNPGEPQLGCGQSSPQMGNTGRQGRRRQERRKGRGLRRKELIASSVFKLLTHIILAITEVYIYMKLNF